MHSLESRPRYVEVVSPPLISHGLFLSGLLTGRIPVPAPASSAWLLPADVYAQFGGEDILVEWCPQERTPKRPQYPISALRRLLRADHFNPNLSYRRHPAEELPKEPDTKRLYVPQWVSFVYGSISTA